MRISGRVDLLPMLADCERGLGRPERALEIAASEDAAKLDVPGTIELMIVVAGAYADTGDIETALGTLDVPALRSKVNGKWQVRLWVAYADLLERAGRTEESQRWIRLAADADTDHETDAGERLGRPAPEPDIDDLPWDDSEELSVLDAFDDSQDPEDPDEEAAQDPEDSARGESGSDERSAAPDEQDSSPEQQSAPAVDQPAAPGDEPATPDDDSATPEDRAGTSNGTEEQS
jgi:hypothetical protein